MESLLRDAEAEIRPNTTLELDDPAHEPAVIGPPVPDAPPPTAPSAVPGTIDYDLLAEAIVRAQARAAGVPASSDAPAATPPPAPTGAVQAPPSWIPPASPDIPAPAGHAGAEAAATQAP